jgi:hypothetical protein
MVKPRGCWRLGIVLYGYFPGNTQVFFVLLLCCLLHVVIDSAVVNVAPIFLLFLQVHTAIR